MPEGFEADRTRIQIKQGTKGRQGMLLLLYPLSTIIHCKFKGRFILFPRTFALGTSQRPWTTVTVNNTEYLSSGIEEPLTTDLDVHDAERLKSAKYRDLQYLMGDLQYGNIVVEKRGKQLVVAAGYVSFIHCYSSTNNNLPQHAAVIHFGLEAHIVPMSTKQLDALVTVDRAGPNKSKAKAEKLRTFDVPFSFITPNSKADANGRQTHAVVIAALVTSTQAFAFLDFSRMLRLHFISIGRHWTQSDVSPGSSVRLSLFLKSVF